MRYVRSQNLYRNVLTVRVCVFSRMEPSKQDSAGLQKSGNKPGGGDLARGCYYRARTYDASGRMHQRLLNAYFDYISNQIRDEACGAGSGHWQDRQATFTFCKSADVECATSTRLASYNTFKAFYRDKVAPKLAKWDDEDEVLLRIDFGDYDNPSGLDDGEVNELIYRLEKREKYFHVEFARIESKHGDETITVHW